jgi:transcriptional regulator with XRE-family HTH domain
MANFFSTNIKYLRKGKGMTQEDFANKIGVKRSLIGSYEEGRAEPRLSNVENIAYHFNVTIDELLHIDLSKGDKNLAGQSKVRDIEGLGLRILPIIVDKDDENEFITMVPIDAKAGYLGGYKDPEFIGELQRTRLPIPELLNKGTIRAFQIKGESMLPISSGSYIFCEYVQNWASIKDGQCFIFIMKEEQDIVFKRAINLISESKEILLKSDNSEFEPYKVSVNNILEIWKALGYLSFHLPNPDDTAISLQKLSTIVKELRQDIDKMK